jgi:predicted DNA binding CopG/RHH family protein
MKEKKEEWVMVRLTKKEKHRVKEMAERAGLPVSTYIRTKVLYGEVK